MSKIKSIFSRDIGEAIREGRADERETCEKEKEDALERQRRRLEGEWALELKKKDAKIESLGLRIEQFKKREKNLEKEHQRLREQWLVLKRIVVELKDAAERRRIELLESTQIFDLLMKDIETIKRLEDKSE